MIQAGKYRQVVTIQSRTETQDVHGGTVYAWTYVATVRAKIRPLRGRELISAQAEQSEASVMFYMRHRADIDTSSRLVCDGKYYDITAVVDVDYRHRELEISAKTGTSEG